MKKNIVLAALLLGTATPLFAQSKYFTKSGEISFSASTSIEDISATNNKATCVLDAASGAFESAVLMKAFIFERALMQEHFNENYVESDQYPKATLKGKIVNFSDVDLSKDGTYPVKMTGTLTMHGVTKDVAPKGKLVVKGGKVDALAEFSVLLADYNIEIPGVVKDKISKTVKISTNFWLDPLK